MSKNDFFNLTSCNYIQHITLHNIFFVVINNLKYENYPKLFLLFSGDVSLNPGPIQRSPDINSTIWEPFYQKGLHFLDINSNSLLSKKD